MCVIVVKPVGKDLPSKQVLKKCWKVNNDGAGFAIQIEKDIFIKKGFMKFEDLMESLEKLRSEIGEKELKRKNMVVHFRLASCVTVASQYTHPFPLSSKLRDLMASEVQCKIAVAHNGVFGGFGNEVLSDTQDFIRSILVPLGRRIYEKQVLKLVEKILGYSKLAILFTEKQEKGRVELLGDFKEKDGYWFSNLNWEIEPFYYTSKGYKRGRYVYDNGVWKYYVDLNEY